MFDNRYHYVDGRHFGPCSTHAGILNPSSAVIAASKHETERDKVRIANAPFGSIHQTAVHGSSGSHQIQEELIDHPLLFCCCFYYARKPHPWLKSSRTSRRSHVLDYPPYPPCNRIELSRTHGLHHCALKNADRELCLTPRVRKWRRRTQLGWVTTVGAIGAATLSPRHGVTSTVLS